MSLHCVHKQLAIKKSARPPWCCARERATQAVRYAHGSWLNQVPQGADSPVPCPFLAGVTGRLLPPGHRFHICCQFVSCCKPPSRHVRRSANRAALCKARALALVAAVADVACIQRFFSCIIAPSRNSLWSRLFSLMEMVAALVQKGTTVGMDRAPAMNASTSTEPTEPINCAK